MSPTQSSKEQKDFARNQLINSEIARDSLPYHSKFDEIFNEYNNSGLPKLSKHDYWRLLLRVGKPGGAKHINKLKLPVINATEAEKFEILRLLPDSPGERDRLPYTTAFDEIYSNFKKHTKRNITRNDFWRLLLKVAKNSRRPQPIDINPSNALSASLLEGLHAMNPWWQGDSMGKIPEYKRSIYPHLYNSVTAGLYKIVALRGPRQVGKTVLQEQMIQDLLETKRMVLPNQILRVQFENLSSLDIADPIVTIIRWFEKNVVKDTFNNLYDKGKPVYIFLDEFQSLENWSSQLKHISDLGECRFFITGSSALRIIAGKESLAGRVQWNEINTLGLSEICGFRNFGVLTPYQKKIDLCEWKKKEFWIALKAGEWQKEGTKPLLLDEVYKNFCDFGGYPFCYQRKEVSREDADEYLNETVVAKTISLDLKAKFESEYGGPVDFMNVTLLSNAFKTLCKFTGQHISIERLGKELSVAHSLHFKHDQIRKILEFFELSMLIKVVRPFEHRLKNPKECVKICLCDHAIRKAWFKEDILLYGSDANSDLAGHVIEGIIGTYFKSVKQLGVSYFPPVGKENEAESEVDFILEVGIQHIPVEVKYKNNPDLGEKAGIRAFLDKEAYNAPFGLVITKDEVPLDYFGDDRIIPISAKQLLLLK